MGIVRFALNFLVMMALWTTLGQFSFRGVKLEERYHAWVNSHHMQQVFDTALAPIHWSKDKVTNLWEDISPSTSQAR